MAALILPLIEANAHWPARGALVGLDLGTKTIGVAVSDPDRRLATGVETIQRKAFKADAARLLAIAAERNVVGFVLGLPVNMDASEGPRAQSTRAFARNFSKLTDLPIALWDERLSTSAVERELIGTDMSRFPSAAHLSSWAGMCPGNNQSGDKRKRCKMNDGNRWLKRTLTQSAWAASRTRNAYFKDLYHRLAGRRGRKRAAMAVGHSQLVTIYHMLRDGVGYKDLGPNHFATLVDSQRVAPLVKRLEKLGYHVTLTNAA